MLPLFSLGVPARFADRMVVTLAAGLIGGGPEVLLLVAPAAGQGYDILLPGAAKTGSSGCWRSNLQARAELVISAP